MSHQLLDATRLGLVLTRMAHQIADRNGDENGVIVVGVQSGGIHLARRLALLLREIWKRDVPHGTLDVSMHRDDLDERGTLIMRSTNLPGDITGRTVVLVDDVLNSGRTARAALDALNDFGRPRRIQLAVLVDRGGRELPIAADFVGETASPRANQRIDVHLTEHSQRDEVLVEDATS
ncbi:MAG: bifunctional pyr operon transcriptional regulator/uracil phosphoribosyltransferase PyrR [Pedosphaera sp.]|nr:bifunctional pyr operon transcriptional regulator/uracil phosphoribosyltransferase PyrR [Pedosphaera sp.]